jgi:putative ABC transport system ATP-binding protein
VIEMMRSLAHQRDRAVVIVTHDARMLDFADRTIRLEDGLVMPSDPTETPAALLTAQMQTGAGLSLAQ